MSKITVRAGNPKEEAELQKYRYHVCIVHDEPPDYMVKDFPEQVAQTQGQDDKWFTEALAFSHCPMQAWHTLQFMAVKYPGACLIVMDLEVGHPVLQMDSDKGFFESVCEAAKQRQGEFDMAQRDALYGDSPQGKH